MTFAARVAYASLDFFSSSNSFSFCVRAALRDICRIVWLFETALSCSSLSLQSCSNSSHLRRIRSSSLLDDGSCSEESLAFFSTAGRFLSSSSLPFLTAAPKKWRMRVLFFGIFVLAFPGLERSRELLVYSAMFVCFGDTCSANWRERLRLRDVGVASLTLFARSVTEGLDLFAGTDFRLSDCRQR